MNLFKVKGDISVTLGKKNKLEIELPDDMSDTDLVKAIRLHGKRGLLIQVGDPQADMEDYGITIPRPGVTARVEQSGVVASVTKPDEEQQLEMADGGADTEGEQQEDTDEPGEGPDELSFDETGEPSEEAGIEAKGQEPIEDDETLLDAIDRGEFRPTIVPSLKPEPEKEAVEEFILEQKPTFEDIPYDFPTLLQRKRGGETWLQIAVSEHVTSGKLSSAWSEYKNRIKKQMMA